MSVEDLDLLLILKPWASETDRRWFLHALTLGGFLTDSRREEAAKALAASKSESGQIDLPAGIVDKIGSGLYFLIMCINDQGPPPGEGAIAGGDVTSRMEDSFKQ